MEDQRRCAAALGADAHRAVSALRRAACVLRNVGGPNKRALAALCEEAAERLEPLA